MKPETLNIIGLSANIIGTIILSFSISGYIRSMRIAIDAHELYIISQNHPTLPPVQVTGTDWHMNRDKKWSTFFTTIGVIFVLFGFAFQLFALIN